MIVQHLHLDFPSLRDVQWARSNRDSALKPGHTKKRPESCWDQCICTGTTQQLWNISCVLCSSAM